MEKSWKIKIKALVSSLLVSDIDFSSDEDYLHQFTRTSEHKEDSTKQFSACYLLYFVLCSKAFHCISAQSVNNIIVMNMNL